MNTLFNYQKFLRPAFWMSIWGILWKIEGGHFEMHLAQNFDGFARLLAIFSEIRHNEHARGV